MMRNPKNEKLRNRGQGKPNANVLAFNIVQQATEQVEKPEPSRVEIVTIAIYITLQLFTIAHHQPAALLESCFHMPMGRCAYLPTTGSARPLIRLARSV